MKSKVTFDLGDYNKSVVKVHTQYSEDVRDKIARDFSGGFGYNSNLAYCKFLPVDSGQSLMEITPFDGSIDDSQRIVKDLPTEQLESMQKAITEQLSWRKNLENEGKQKA